MKCENVRELAHYKILEGSHFGKFSAIFKMTVAAVDSGNVGKL